MSKSDRLQALTALLQDGKTHKAEDLAVAFDVSPRTIYRDMSRLQSSGVPIKGTPGDGYQATAEITLPPISLTGVELEVLRLGLSVITDAGDEMQKNAAIAMQSKLDIALGEDVGSTGVSPIAAGPLLQQHLTQVRLAISAKQKLRASVGTRTTIIRPLRLDFFGRIWRCVCWDEGRNEFDAIALADIGFLAVLPGLFVDEAGKTLKDYLLS